MDKSKIHPTPMLDVLEDGPWPSFVSGFKRMRDEHPDSRINETINSLLGQLEHSYETRKGYWKGGTVSVFGYGGGIIPRFSEVGSAFPESKEFHTLRVQPAPGNYYTTDMLNQLADSWEKWGSGMVTFHGQTGNIMFIGTTTDNTQHFFDEINEYGWDLGGAGPCVRTAMSVSVRPVASSLVPTNMASSVTWSTPLPMTCIVLPCLTSSNSRFPVVPNDCQNSIERSDFSVIGTWRDEMKIDQAEVKAFIDAKGRDYVLDNVTSRCPTDCMTLNDDNTLDVDSHNCVRCMHCLNVMTKALSPGDDKGVTILIGGKRTLKIGDLMGTVVVPFMKLDTAEDYEKLVELASEIIDFFAENALEHERTGEMIERIGLVNFLEGVGVEVDPNMVSSPRQSSYVRMDGWDEEAEKWFNRKAEQAAG